MNTDFFFLKDYLIFIFKIVLCMFSSYHLIISSKSYTEKKKQKNLESMFIQNN